MPDMLVKLYALPPLQPVLDRQAQNGIDVRRGIAPEKNLALRWVRDNFREHWVGECDIAYTRSPVSCFLAVQGQTVLGFACYDTTRKGFFGPIGVSEDARGKDVGTALLLACLHDMWNQGYGYAVIGAAGPVDFYTKTVGAIAIEGSEPGVYKGMLRE
jgi:GNAT superfamily N-acetyltransferase